MRPEAAHGVLPLDKPVGPTSHDIVAAARRALRTRRIGHTGTLDPFASGLLLLCIGSATRIAEYLTGLDKRYRATVRLGTGTDTDDLTGAVLHERDTSALSLEGIRHALGGMTGEVLQRPPAYSAKKVAGERAHAAARAGRPLEMEPVTVRIEAIDVVRWEPPDLELEVACGSGTYIRAIARDLGTALGVGGHLTALRRTRIGTFDVSAAVHAGDLDRSDAVAEALLAPAEALRHLPRVQLDEQQLGDVRHGRPPRGVRCEDEGVVAVVDAEGQLAAIGSCNAGMLQPRKVFL